MSTNTDFSAMSGQQLLDAHNSLAGLLGRPTKRAKFQSKPEGVRRCQELQAQVDQMTPAPTATPRKRASHDKVIRLEVTENPRREGSDAAAHFEKMRGGITVGEYLSKFPKPERAVAQRWLTNTVRDGFAKLLG